MFSVNCYVKFNTAKRNQSNREQSIFVFTYTHSLIYAREIIISWMHFKVVHGKMFWYQKNLCAKGRQHFQLYRKWNWGTNKIWWFTQIFLLFNLWHAKPVLCISNVHLSLVGFLFSSFLNLLLFYKNIIVLQKFKMRIFEEKRNPKLLVSSAQKRLLLTPLILLQACVYVGFFLQNGLRLCMIICIWIVTLNHESTSSFLLWRIVRMHL